MPEGSAALADAEKLLELGEFERATAKYRQMALDGLVLDGLDGSDDAPGLFRQACEIVEDDPALLIGWGTVLAGAKMTEQAGWRFDRAIEIDAKRVTAHLAAGNAFLAAKRTTEATARFSHVVESLDGESAAAYGGWGKARQMDGELDDALDKLGRAIELAPARPVAIDYRVDAGEILEVLNRPREALDAYRGALALEVADSSPGQALIVRYRAALAALTSNEPREAHEHCFAGLALLEGLEFDDPGAMRAPFHYMKGLAEAVLALYSDAIESLRAAAEASDSFALYALQMVARVLQEQGRYVEYWQELEGVDEAYRRVVAWESAAHGAEWDESELDDEQLDSYGGALLSLGRFEEAGAAFRQALGPLERNPTAWVKLMALYLDRSELQPEEASHFHLLAREAYRKAIPLVEEQRDDERFADPVLGLGMLHLLMDDVDRAEPLLEEAARLDGDSSDAVAGLGIVRARRRRYGEAVEKFRLAQRRDPDNLTLKCHLADAYFRLRQPEAALDTYDDVLRIAPGNVGAHIGSGEILVQRAEETDDDQLYEDAEMHFREAIDLAQSVVRGSAVRRGSHALGPRRLANLYYARGYTRVKIYESLVGDRIGPPSREARRWLEAALGDFQEAKALKVNAHRAARAAQRVSERLKRLSFSTLSDSYAPLIVAAAAFLTLTVVQVSFYTAGGFSSGPNPAAYATLTLSLLVLFAGGFYLPQVLRLKLGGIQLEKAATQQAVGGALNVHRQPFQERIHALFQPVVPRKRSLDRSGAA